MAELVDPYAGLPEYDRDQYDDYQTFVEEERAAFDELFEREPDNPEEDGLAGVIVKFPRADGYAHYRVVGVDPLRLQHIPYGDAYQIPGPHIRGLRENNIWDKIRHRNALQELGE